MQCTIPISLFTRGVLFQELVPAAFLFICAVGLAFYGGLEPRKKAFGIAVLCAIGLAMSASTVMLAVRSKVVVDRSGVNLHAGFWSAHLQRGSLIDIQATDQIGASLRKRTNGMSTQGINAGWFQDPSGRKTFAISSGATRVLVPTTAGFNLVLDRSTYDELKRCGVTASDR